MWSANQKIESLENIARNVHKEYIHDRIDEELSRHQQGIKHSMYNIIRDALMTYMSNIRLSFLNERGNLVFRNFMLRQMQDCYDSDPDGHFRNHINHVFFTLRDGKDLFIYKQNNTWDMKIFNFYGDLTPEYSNAVNLFDVLVAVETLHHMKYRNETQKENIRRVIEELIL